jgi:phosphatidylinositol alpha-1,6-mannosyltransferase
MVQPTSSARLAGGLRVLALVTDAYGSGGGIAQYNRDLFAALARSERVREIVVLPRSGLAGADALPPRVVELPAREGKASYVAAALRAMRDRGPFDVVFCGHLYAAPLAAALRRGGIS